MWYAAGLQSQHPWVRFLPTLLLVPFPYSETTMDIVFNHNVGLTALRNGQAKRLRFGSHEKLANARFTDADATRDTLMLPAPSHRDIVLADGTVLKDVPISVFRVESSFSNEATTKRSNAKAVASSAK